jgi:hypothetical protein
MVVTNDARRARRGGFALLLVLLTIAMATVLGGIYLTETSMHMACTTNTLNAAAARYLAEAGLEHSLYVLQTNPSGLLLTSPENPMGDFYLDANGGAYLFYAAAGSGADSIYTIVATGDSGGMSQSASFVVYNRNLFDDEMHSLSPVSYWRLGELLDLVAWDARFHHHGVYVGARRDEAGALVGSRNRAAYFDGTNDCVDTGSWSVSGRAMTLMAWIKPENVDAQSEGTIISKASGTGAADHYWTLSTTQTSGDVRLRLRVKIGGQVHDVKASTGALQSDEWVLATAVYDGTKVLLYQDGVEVGRAGHSGRIATNNRVSVWIGGNPPDRWANPFRGVLDEVAVFDRALTPQEVAGMLQARMPTPQIIQWND